MRFARMHRPPTRRTRGLSLLIVALGTFAPVAAFAVLGGCEVMADLGRYDVVTNAPDAMPDAAPPPDACACGTRCCSAGSACLDNRGEGICEHDVAELSAGGESACALLANGTLWCWGGNQFGTLGVGPAGDEQCVAANVPVACRYRPVQVEGLNDVAHVSEGQLITCAIKRDNSVWCWGKNEHGELGHQPGSNGDRTCTVNLDASSAAFPCNPIPKQVPGVSALEVTAGAFHVCAVQTDHSVACWGWNDRAELGDPDTGPAGRSEPRVIRGLPPIAHVATGLNVKHSCAVALEGGGVWCWGDDPSGQLGIPSELDQVCADGTPCSFIPRQVTTGVVLGDASAYVPFEGAIDVRTGFLFSCALRSSGVVWCWGDSGYGTLGLPADASGPQRSPIAIGGLPPVRKLDARFQHVCALVEGGATWCWGDNYLGEIGVGTTVGEVCLGIPKQTCRPSPERALRNGTNIAVATGISTSFSLSDDHRTIWAWGTNDTGRLAHSPIPGQDNLNCADNLQSVCNPYPTAIGGFPP